MESKKKELEKVVKELRKKKKAVDDKRRKRLGNRA